MPDLNDILADYIERMEAINEKKMALTRKQLDYELHEARAFNLMRQQLYEIGWTHGVPEDSVPVQEAGDDIQRGEEAL